MRTDRGNFHYYRLGVVRTHYRIDKYICTVLCDVECIWRVADFFGENQKQPLSDRVRVKDKQRRPLVISLFITDFFTMVWIIASLVLNLFAYSSFSFTPPRKVTPFKYLHKTQQQCRHKSEILTDEDKFKVYVDKSSSTSTTTLLSSSSSYTSSEFSVDPYSEESKKLILEYFGLTWNQYQKLVTLSELVVRWNERINVVSRKDCTVPVVFGRHILPSLSLLKIRIQDIGINNSDDGDNNNNIPTKNIDSVNSSTFLLSSSSIKKIVDVGTGGGFPGIPLAIALPNTQFVLVDSVGKKLIVVQELIQELGLANVSTHHGRAEDMAEDILHSRTHRKAYDICVGRSVTSFPQFCAWIHNLLRHKTGKLVYILGGDVESSILEKVTMDIPMDTLLEHEVASDNNKRILVVSQDMVKAIVNESEGVKQFRGSPRALNGPTPNKRKQTKGAWSKRDPDAGPKKRGYENFKRYGY
jgi:16S rRNA (guanine527-N7)-methyltransferase